MQIYENTVEEICLGELDISSRTEEALEEAAHSLQVITKKIDLEISPQHSPKCTLDTEGQADGKKTKKKAVKKGQTKCKCFHFFQLSFLNLPYCDVYCIVVSTTE